MYLSPWSIKPITVFHVCSTDRQWSRLRPKLSIVCVIGPPLWYQVLACGDAKVLIKQEAMLRLSEYCNPKQLYSFVYGSTGCDAIKEWYFVGPDEEWSVELPDIYWRSLISTLDISK